MIVYHGSLSVIKLPDILHSQKRLDFGPGFYVTQNNDQAIRWAFRKADMMGLAKGIINSFELTEKPGVKIMDLGDDMGTWLDFVCDCRNGNDIYARYDVIKGRVADDRVFRVVSMYRRGIWDKQRAIKEMRAYDKYDQIAFITQEAIDAMLLFRGSSEVAL